MAQQTKTKRQDAAFELQPRKIPDTQRTEEIVNLILATSAQLLDQVGLEGFNTTLLSEQAGIRVATIYQYFPNKLAILSALVQKWWDLMKEELLVDDLADPNSDWQDVICSIIDAYTATARKQSGFFAIRRAMQAAPELRSIERDMARDLSRGIVIALRKRGVRLDQLRLHTIVEIFLITGAALYDVAWLRGRKDIVLEEEFLEELKLLEISYLANYLERDLKLSSR